MNCSWCWFVCFQFSPNKVTVLPSCHIWRRNGPAGSKQLCSVEDRSSSKAAKARKWTFQHVWIILLPPNWTELGCSQIWSKILKPVILSWGCLRQGGTSEESAKGAKEKQTFCQQACICCHQVLTPIGSIFMNPQVDKTEKHLAQNIFAECSVLPSEQMFTAELWLSLWQRVSSAQESPLEEISPLLPLTQFWLRCSLVSPVQTALVCPKANGQRHSRSAPNGLQLLVGVFSPHSQATACLKPLKLLPYRHKDGHTM